MLHWGSSSVGGASFVRSKASCIFLWIAFACMYSGFYCLISKNLYYLLTKMQHFMSLLLTLDIAREYLWKIKVLPGIDLFPSILSRCKEDEAEYEALYIKALLWELLGNALSPCLSILVFVMFSSEQLIGNSLQKQNVYEISGVFV